MSRQPRGEIRHAQIDLGLQSRRVRRGVHSGFVRQDLGVVEPFGVAQSCRRSFAEKECSAGALLAEDPAAASL